MKFKCSVEINLPLERVVELFDNPDNLKEWQDGFISYEHMSGNPGEIGAMARMRYKVGSREIELVETIVKNELPYEFTGLYDAKEMTNTMKNTFHVVSEKVTRYDADVEYLKMRGFMVNVMAKLFPGMFRKQVQKWMNQFRDFCEREGAGNQNTSMA